MTTERNTGAGENQGLPAASGPDGAAAGADSTRRRVILRALVAAGYVAGLGFAAGSWARPAGGEAVPEGQDPRLGEVHGCGEGLPPGHPPVETLMAFSAGPPADPGHAAPAGRPSAPPAGAASGLHAAAAAGLHDLRAAPGARGAGDPAVHLGPPLEQPLVAAAQRDRGGGEAPEPHPDRRAHQAAAPEGGEVLGPLEPAVLDQQQVDPGRGRQQRERPPEARRQDVAEARGDGGELLQLPFPERLDAAGEPLRCEPGPLRVDEGGRARVEVPGEPGHGLDLGPRLRVPLR